MRLFQTAIVRWVEVKTDCMAGPAKEHIQKLLLECKALHVKLTCSSVQ